MIAPQNYTVETSDQSINFSVPFKRLRTSIFSVGIEIFVLFGISLYGFFNTSYPIPTYLLPFIILFLLLFFVELFWLLNGMEFLDVSNNQIVMKHQIFGVGLSKKFVPNKIDGIFISRQKIDDLMWVRENNGFRFSDFQKGKVAINYGKTLLGRIRTYRFGTNLNEVEAQEIVKLILEKYPQYSPKKKPG
jgi:hypothetical protein